MKTRKITILLFIIAIMTVIYGCSLFLFHPSRTFSANSVVQKADPKDIFFSSGDGEILHGWFFRATRPKGTVLVFHGNAENITTHVNGVLWLVTEGFNLFVVDYRGYGLSTGRPDLRGVHRDGVAAFEFLLTLSDVDVDKIALIGQSIGGSIATYVAATAPQRDKVRLLVLDSSIFGYRLIARDKLADFFLTWPLQYPFSLLLNDYFSPSLWIGQVNSPVIVINDSNDEIVPTYHSDQLYAAIRSPKEIWRTDGYGHISSMKNERIRKLFVMRLLDNFGHN